MSGDLAGRSGGGSGRGGKERRPGLLQYGHFSVAKLARWINDGSKFPLIHMIGTAL